ncbi:MAG: response regulator transcription factor [Rhizobiales bacterium]|nr:response regulator transcription factor [Hyphomicrobiales bacterium]
MNVLLVEDDVGIARFVERGLTLEGMRVQWTATGEEALAYLRSYQYDAIILDLMLPDMDGRNVCKTLRGQGVSTPICMLTAKDSIDEKLSGFEVGADDYLTKPFAFEELLARIKVMQRRSNTNMDGEEMNIGPIALNLAAHEARVSDKLLELTQREFALLEYLMRYVGKTVSRERIIENAWGPSSDITSNAVDVYVGYLRKKIDEVSNEVEIRTVRGIGFKLMIKDQSNSQ